MTPTEAPEQMVLRSFNDQGLEQAERVLAEIGAGHTADIEGLLLDESLTVVHGDEPTLLRRRFASRFEAAKYFDELLAPHESVIPDIERNRGLWTWLGLCWLELLAKQSDGSYKVGEWRRWILSADRRHYRHLLATPYRIYRTHRDDLACTLVVLSGPVETPGNITEQIASRQDLVKSRNIMHTLTEMYYVPAQGSAAEDVAAGTVGSLREGAPTSAVRMGKVLGQFYLNWDMFAMEPREILAKLPPEFDKFAPSN